ncbi:MAG: 50S ribosomal protein L6 [bacterium]|nr:50S ribosomal protein L6 [bacterium]
MSRIGKKPIEIPKGVSIDINNHLIKITGPKGSLSRELLPLVKVKVEDEKIIVSVDKGDRRSRAFHGLFRALINNMVVGVNSGFTKLLLINGVGYKAALQGKILNLQLGYSHPISYVPPEGIALEVPTPTQINVSGIDKELVGEIAARIRAFRKPDAYKAKGIKYNYEVIRRKPTKSGVK